MKTYTAFCQEASGQGTIWIESIQADDVEHACTVAREMCADAWEYDPEDIHVLGLAEGDVQIAYWDDIDQ